MKRFDLHTIRKRLLPLLLAAALFCCLAGCAGMTSRDPKADEKSEEMLTAMHTVMKLTAYGSHAREGLSAAKEEILRLDALLNVESENSELYSLNRDGHGIACSDTASLIRASLALFEDTDGAFDITVYPLMRLWGFPQETCHVPTPEELAAVLPLIDAGRISLDPETGEVVLGAGQAIDLGGIAKGYTSARVTQLLRDAGVTSALVSLGGNVQCLGTKPDGSPWRVGIRDPENSEEPLLILSVSDLAVITSGGYERYFTDEATGVTYEHILDPATGYPSAGDLASCTIVAEDGTLADGLSTALYLMGFEKACEYWRDRKETFDMILLTRGGELYVTEGLEGRFESVHSITLLR